MKEFKLCKLYILFIAITLMLLQLFPKIKIYHGYTEYARIIERTAIYKSDLVTDNSNIICLLEPTYFVEIISDYNDKVCLVNYKGIDGYVLKSDIKKVSETPKNPYPSSKIKTFSNKCNLRSSPSADGTVLVPIPANTELDYIGKVYGESVMDYNGEIWYLVDYLGFKGYVYNGYLTSLPLVSPNTEEISFLEGNNFLQVNPLSNESCIIMIVLILIPSILILILLFKKPKLVQKKTRVIRNNDKIDYDSLL